MSSILNPQPNESADYNNSPNCWQCRHFSISWEPATPYMCGLMGFKSRLMPSVEVLRADGKMCRGFMAKPTPHQQNAQPQAHTNTGNNRTNNNTNSTFMSQVLNAKNGQPVTSTSKSVWSA